jgi:hypothetical protein
VSVSRQRFDVFLAYSTEDRAAAEPVIEVLKRSGFSVWWDIESIPIGSDFADFMFEAVSAASCVVVLWSTSSVQSEWVLREADMGRRRAVLLPVLLKPVTIPPAFQSIQTADLTGWTGDLEFAGLKRLLDAVRLFVGTAPSDADRTRFYKESQLDAERRAETLLRQNLRSRTRVEHLELGDTAFYQSLAWNLQPGMNVLLGRNGFGKTYLLRGLVALLQYSDEAARDILGDGSASLEIVRDGHEAGIRYADHFFDEHDAVGRVPVLAVPDTRFVNRSVTTIGAVQDRATGGDDRADLARHGAWHFLEEQPYENMIQTLLYGLCLDAVEADGRFEGAQFVLIRDVVRELTDSSFAFDRVAREGRNRFTLYVQTEGSEGRALPIQKASQGTASVIALVGLIYDFLKSLRQDGAPEVCKRTGIVIIDEVDAHLHPVWQHKLVAILRDRFPAVQFIVTAHNPIVVAGCLEDEVSVLRKDPQRGFTLVQFPNDFIGWQTEDIYRKVFEIESPDASFAHYDALRPFKGEMQAEGKALAEKPTRNDDEEHRLELIEQQLLYIDKVEQSRQSRLSQEELERENRMLLDRLQSQDAAQRLTAQSAQDLGSMRAALAEATSRARSARRYAAMMLLVALLVALVGWLAGHS